MSPASTDKIHLAVKVRWLLPIYRKTYIEVVTERMSKKEVQEVTLLGSREEQSEFIGTVAPVIESAMNQEKRAKGRSIDSSVSREMAGKIYLWRARGAHLGLDFKGTFGAALKRGWAQSAMKQSKEVLAALEALNAALCPQEFAGVSSVNDRLGPIGDYIATEAEANDISAGDIVKTLAILKLAAERAAADGHRDYAEWLSVNSGNKPTPISYLRLILDDCIGDRLRFRRARARSIAAALVAGGVVEPNEESDEVERIVQTLYNKGR